MKAVWLIGFFLVPTLSCAQIPGASPELFKVCSDVLVEDIVNTKRDTTEFRHALTLVTDEIYNKKNLSNKTDLGIEGFSFGNNYKEFDENRRKFLNRVGFKSSSTESSAQLTSRVPAVARQNWLKCIQTIALAKPNIGIYIYVEDATKIPYLVKIGARLPPDYHAKIRQSSITNGFEQVGTVQRTTLLLPDDVLRNGNERTYYITPIESSKPVILTLELLNGDKPSIGIFPASQTEDARTGQTPKVYSLTASQWSNAAGSNGVQGINMSTPCGQPGDAGYACSADPTQPTRLVYDLRRNHLEIPAGSYELTIEYSSDIHIPRVSLKANGTEQSISFPPTGGLGISARNTIRTTVIFSGAHADLVVDRGGRLPNLRGFTFTPVSR